MGQKIKTIINRNQTAGNHSVVWDGKDNFGNTCGSGLYFHQLNINGKTISANKCLLLK